MPNKEDLYQIADELRAVASIGLRYSDHGYDKERYEKILKTSARLVASIEDADPDEIYTQYTGNLVHISPILCVEAVVVRDGKILLIQRSDDHLWALPGGLAEVGESPAQAVERELWEESGVRGRADRLLGIFDTRLWPTRTRLQLCICMFLVASEEIPALHSQESGTPSSLAESLDVGFFAENELPGLSVGHDLRVPMAFKILRGETPAPFFDRS